LKLVNKSTKIKVLAQGELNASVNFTVHAMSAKAKEVIESKGNTVTLI
jgi:ribosomal protein L15